PRGQRRPVAPPTPALTPPVSAVTSHEQKQPARPPSASEPANSRSRNSRTKPPAVDTPLLSRLGAPSASTINGRTSLHSRPPSPQPSGGIAIESICRSWLTSRHLASPALISL